MCISYDLAVPPLGIPPVEIHTYVHRNSGAKKMFKAALFVIAPRLETAQLPSTVEWMNTLWAIQVVEYYTAMKKKKSCYMSQHG